MVFCNLRHGNGWNGHIEVTILILIDGFLQLVHHKVTLNPIIVTILILIDGFLQYTKREHYLVQISVTILILIDGFLQYRFLNCVLKNHISHNPYFNRWFSAMVCNHCYAKNNEGHNPYFNRWFSAIYIC